MSASNNTAAFRNFSLAASGAVLAASAWAAGAAPEGLMLDARLWREEIPAANDGAEEGWYEIALAASAVHVRAVTQPRRGHAAVQQALYLHRPGMALVEGVRVNHGFPSEALRPVVGHKYTRTLGRTEFAFKVWSNAVGTAYVISYDGVDHEYLLGLPAADTRVHAIADLDGDRKPDFVVEVGGEIFLLLSSDARPGMNFPSAQLWASAG